MVFPRDREHMVRPSRNMIETPASKTSDSGCATKIKDRLADHTCAAKALSPSTNRAAIYAKHKLRHEYNLLTG